jgi:hypothetical protein
LKDITEYTDVILSYDEMSILVEKSNIQNASLLSTITSLFEKTYHKARTKESNMNISQARISLLCASTLETFLGMFSEKYQKIGFINRLFLVPSRSEKSFAVPKRVPEKFYAQLQEELRNVRLFINRLARTEGQGDLYYMPMEKEAEMIWSECYDSIRQMKSEVASRLDGYAMRLMVLLAINQQKEYIDAQTAQDAVDLINWQKGVRLQNWPRSYAHAAAELEDNIRRCFYEKSDWTKTELRIKCKFKRYSNRFVERALQALSDNGEIMMAEQKAEGRGRPTQVDRRLKLAE